MKIDRYKMQMHPRFDAVELVIDPDGSVCYTRDVEKLETINAELLEALEWLVTIQSIVSISEDMHRLTYQRAVEQARAAIAKAKGEQP